MNAYTVFCLAVIAVAGAGIDPPQFRFGFAQGGGDLGQNAGDAFAVLLRRGRGRAELEFFLLIDQRRRGLRRDDRAAAQHRGVGRRAPQFL